MKLGSCSAARTLRAKRRPQSVSLPSFPTGRSELCALPNQGEASPLTLSGSWTLLPSEEKTKDKKWTCFHQVPQAPLLTEDSISPLIKGIVIGLLCGGKGLQGPRVTVTRAVPNA